MLLHITGKPRRKGGAWYHGIAAVGLVLAGLFLFGAAGCRFPGQPRTALQVGPSPGELSKYDEAVTVYLAGKYAPAAEKFTAIREQTSDPGMARMALFGLACSRLMLAEDPQAYHEALALWNAWVQCANGSKSPHRESPRLLAPLVNNKMVFSHIPMSDVNVPDDKEDQKVSRWLMVQANKELQRLKQQTEDDQLKIAARDKRVESLEKEITRLKEQIKAFETIDQKIQKKKNAIPSAD